MTVSVRRIAVDDWPDIVELEAAAYEAYGLSEGPVALRSRAEASPATSFVVHTGERVAGYLLALPYPRFRWPDLTRAEEVNFESANLHLHDVVVGADFRGAGLAGRLLRRLTEVAFGRQHDRISLVAVAGSDPFWAAQGYRSHLELAMPSSYGANAVYMSRAL
jgi:ribosomal protein S18 acetylase RimI-like enzyme